MRIAEIASLAGVTTRAVRHYHHVGLLPEPARRPNGYRDYAVRDAVLLARIRRLTALGLSLDEVRDVLADDAGHELAEVLSELDADLARQEAEIRARRRRLAELMAEPPTAEGPLSPALARFLRSLPDLDSPAAAADRALLTLLDPQGRVTGTKAEAEAEGEAEAGGAAEGEAYGPEGLYDALRSLTAAPELHRAYQRLDALDGAPADDPRIGPLVADLNTLVTDEIIAAIPDDDGPPHDGTGLGEALLAEYSPAQAEVVRHLIASIAARTRSHSRTQNQNQSRQRQEEAS
ncbi:MerR family transcriptional regulator [Streptomyces sp. NPDC093085]|uniref:MerR family transcriptional regulator n=1 Tax=Streptomyces sp. NPDC093085 TaxID=3155068 RepID=UPI0034400CF8